MSEYGPAAGSTGIRGARLRWDAPQKTIEKTTRTDKHAMQKRPVRLFLSAFAKRAPGLRQGMTVRHVSARWIRPVKIQSVIKRSNIPKKDANGGPFGLILQKEATPQKPRWPGTKTALRGRPGARRSAAGGCFSLRRASIWCILYSVLVWAAAGTRGRPAQPEPEAAKAWRTRETIPEGRLV